LIDEEAWAAARSGRPLHSPVPSDDDPWHNENPFTAFGSSARTRWI
jgi:hypothetical protein